MGSATRRANLTSASRLRSSKEAQPSPSRRRPSGITRRSPDRRAREGTPTRPDLHTVLGHFNDALALVTVSQIAIDVSDEVALEECALRQGIAALNAVYDELDKADQQLRRSAPDGHLTPRDARRPP